MKTLQLKLISRFFLILIFPLQVLAVNFSGQIFEINADTSKDTPLYKMKHEETKEDDKVKFHNVYTYNDGKEAVVEDGELRGTDVISYHISQKQLGAEGLVEVKDQQVKFTYKQKDHDPKDNKEKYVDNFVIGPSLNPYIKKNWQKLMAGEAVKVRLAVPDRRETVGFDLLKDKTSTDKQAIIKMKASSLVYSALVNPLYFTYLPDGTGMVEMRGRTQVKKQHDGRFSDLDAHTIYKPD